MKWLLTLLLTLAIAAPVAAGEFMVTLTLDEPLVTGDLPKAEHVLAERPGVGRAVLRYDRRHVIAEWRWAEGIDGPAVSTMLPRVPAGEPVTFGWTWDEAAGSAVMSVGGETVQEATGEPWSVPDATGADEPGDLPDGWSASVGDTTPAGPTLRDVLGIDLPEPPSLDGRLGEVLYATDFSEPPEDWAVEGPLRLTHDGGRLVIDSMKPDAERPEHGHGTIWLPVRTPGTFVIDWTFEPLSDDGLAIVFFDARPRDRTIDDVLDPSLPRRDGGFNGYVAGALDSMHVSYYADPPHEPARGTINLRENKGLILRAVAPAFLKGGDGPVRMRLVRDAEALWLLADGEAVMHAPLGGPVHGGQVALRQMQWTRAAYDDLTISELHP